MHDVLAITLTAMQQDASRLDRASANLANAMTPSYKREVSVQRPLTTEPLGRSFAETMEQVPTAASGTASRDRLATLDVTRDMRPGTLRPTGQNLDLALAGPGFFEVTTESGPAYTRSGQFQVDARGRLVSAKGLPVMGIAGEIVLNGSQPTVDASGVVSDQGRVIAQLKVVDFDHRETLQVLDGGLFSAGTSGRLLAGQDVQVRQGFLENSNVNAMHEMVEVMQTMRHFESLQKAVQGYDEMVGTAIRKLGDL